MRGLSLLALIAALVSVDAVAAGDAVTISRSRGKRGGVVVLWPRVVPEQAPDEVDAIAERIHARLDALAARTVPEARVSVRPQPERVCPQQGCKGVSLGAVLGHQEGGCFAVALIGPPDGGAVQLVPWAGKVLAPRGGQVPFREPPENRLMVTEFVPCQDLLGLLDDSRVQAELAKATALASER